MGSVDLTPGAIAAVVGGGAEGTKPVVQALGLRLLDAAAAQRQQSSTVRRYSLCISDGTHLLQAIAAPKLNGLIKDGFLRSGSVVQLKDFIVEVTQGRRLVILIDLEVLVQKSDLIGEPKAFSNFSVPLMNQVILPKTLEFEFKINKLRKELLEGMDKMDTEYRKLLKSARDSEASEQELADEWAAKHMKLIKFLEQLNLPQPFTTKRNSSNTEVSSCDS